MTAEVQSEPAIPETVRDDFPALAQKINGHPLVYFDNAATTQKPRAVLEAVAKYYEHDNANVHRGIHELSNRATAAYEDARDRVARFLNTPAREDIIFTRGTTEAINLVAATWGTDNLSEGDIILLTEMEHHSNLVPWQLLAQRIGARLDHRADCVSGAEQFGGDVTAQETVGPGDQHLHVATRQDRSVAIPRAQWIRRT